MNQPGAAMRPAFLRTPLATFPAYWSWLEWIESAVTRAECEALFVLSALTFGDGCGVEIGSYQGRSALALGYGASLYHRGHVWTIDHHEGDPISGVVPGTWEILNRHIRQAQLTGAVLPIRASSILCAAHWTAGPIRLLFLDGWHDAAAVQADVDAWTPHLAPDGVLVFHDYGRFGVTEIVEAIKGEYPSRGLVESLAILSRQELPLLREMRSLCPPSA